MYVAVSKGLPVLFSDLLKYGRREEIPPPDLRVFAAKEAAERLLLFQLYSPKASYIGLRAVKEANRFSLRVKRAISLSAQAENITFAARQTYHFTCAGGANFTENTDTTTQSETTAHNKIPP